MDDSRKRALDTAVSQIERQFGKGAIMRLGAEPVGVLGSGVISSGSLSVDLALRPDAARVLAAVRETLLA